MATFFNLNTTPTASVTLPGAKETAGLQATLYTASPNGSGLVDFKTDLKFTGSDITDYLKQSLPYCILNEYELLTNSSINSLLYILQGSGYSTTQVTNTLATLATKAAGYLPDLSQLATTEFGTAVQNAATNLGVADYLTGAAQVLQAEAANIVNLLQTKETLNGALKPYQGLYIRANTGFKYILPYFKNTKKQIQNAFTSTEQGLLAGNFVGKGVKWASDKVNEFVQSALFTSPGAYIEQSKFFNLGENGPSYDITFNLINTFNASDVQKHYDFLFLLTFQNLPYRKDLARLRLPSIYSFMLPGEVFLPFAYISNLNVDFLGNRRIIQLTHPTGKIVDTLVPDVYEVTLTVTGLNPDMGNFMVSDVLNIQSALAPTTSVVPINSQPPNVITTPGAPAPIIPATPPSRTYILNNSLPTSV